MDQPDIAPLARRLAEENNVDWRRLRGSGDDGRVVERDVLEYLARVMAGEEAVDPTPEPVPDGMEAWPEDDARAFESDDDLDDLSEPTSTVEDDIFLFEDTPAGAPPLQEPDATGFADADRPPGLLLAEPARDDEDVDEEDLLVAGDAEPLPPEHTPKPAAAFRAPGRHGDDAAATAETDPDLPELFASSDEGEPWQDTPPAVFGDDAEAAGDVRSTPASRQGPSLDDALEDAEPEIYDGASGFDEGLELDEVEVDEPLLVPDDQLDAVPSLDAPVGDAPVDAALVADVPVDDVPVDAALVGDAPVGDAPVGAAPVDDVPVDAAPVADAATEAPLLVPPPAAPGSDETTQAPQPSALPLLSYGRVWRRQVDLSALVAAQADLAIELGRDSPLPLSAFLVRAAHKALGGAGFVALALVEHADVRTVTLPVVADFASTVAALSDPLGRSDAVDADAGVPALVVADLSEFGVDDAVLRLGSPVLTLGRLLIDNQSGGRRAMLALSGDGADGAEAAQLLARVGDLLEAPVRLVL